MAKCPLTGDDCPEHNKKDGCMWWLEYRGDGDVLKASLSGCAIVLQPMLLCENANCLGQVAGQIDQLGSEVSAGRVENIHEGDALRKQLVSLAIGNKQLIQAEHTSTLKLEK